MRFVCLVRWLHCVVSFVANVKIWTSTQDGHLLPISAVIIMIEQISAM